MGQKELPFPFNYAKIYGVDFSDEDIAYIENVICSDKLYRMIKHAYDRWNYTISTTHPEELKLDGFDIVSSKQGNWMQFVENCNLINFLEKFINAPDCPNGVKFFMVKYVGQYLGELKELNGYKNYYNNYLARSFLTESWIRTVCVRKPKKHTMPVRKKNKNKKRKPKIRGIVPGTSRPRLQQNFDNIPTIYMFLEKVHKR